MPTRRPVLLALLCVAVIAGPSLAGSHPPPPPGNLRGTYDAYAKAVTLTWTPPAAGEWMYRVWRDDTQVGKAWSPSYRDSQLPTEPGWVYLVTASPDGGYTWSEPALTPVSSISCEVVTVSTTWSYPYLHVRLHEECVGGMVFDKEFTWTQGA